MANAPQCDQNQHRAMSIVLPVNKLLIPDTLAPTTTSMIVSGMMPTQASAYVAKETAISPKV